MGSVGINQDLSLPNQISLRGGISFHLNDLLFPSKRISLSLICLFYVSCQCRRSLNKVCSCLEQNRTASQSAGPRRSQCALREESSKSFPAPASPSAWDTRDRCVRGDARATRTGRVRKKGFLPYVQNGIIVCFCLVHSIQKGATGRRH